ncbi:unnamed protein product [Rotaria socialis]|uniref:G-protein coupled receptors family 1 profile domain-containing protein n=1 Tax=Rotaria socialis TaxID=392032 RepID=A0A818T2J4_9BILA|nr:unnamed protein product [Rotaria socialis]CAF3325024.1 unnamed protein product [Rotaria socialis]CAF3357106.1 unnamed protein product [Rotaria socialis]CAF3370430.1 unnamed protein product [Rotaria socialis]CAF3680843.1 unnamed protein product [Rotaria socialis]
MTTPCTLTEYEVLNHTLPNKLYLILTPFIICIGLIGNILTVFVFVLTDLKRQSVSIITIALAIADSFVLLIPVAILWLEKLLRQELTDLSPFWCRTHGFFDLTFTCCSSWLMVCIAFERFCAVWLPHNNKAILTHRKTLIVVLIIVFISTVLSTWFIFVVKATKIQTLLLKNSTENTLVTLDNRSLIQSSWKCNLIDDSLYDSMGMFSVIINYVLPFIFLLLLNSTVIYRLCQRGIVDLRSSITVMLTLVCIVHLFCTLPFQCWWIYYEVRDQTGDCSWLKRKLTWHAITFTIRNFNYMANFFLYSCSSKLFRNELKGLIVLSLLPHEKHQSYHYRRQSLYDNRRQQSISLTRLIMRRLSRTAAYKHVGAIHSVAAEIPLTSLNEHG